MLTSVRHLYIYGKTVHHVATEKLSGLSRFHKGLSLAKNQRCSMLSIMHKKSVHDFYIARIGIEKNASYCGLLLVCVASGKEREK